MSNHQREWSVKIAQPPDWVIGVMIVVAHLSGAIRSGGALVSGVILVVGIPVGYVGLIQQFNLKLEDKLIVVALYVFGAGLISERSRRWAEKLILAAGKLINGIAKIN